MKNVLGTYHMVHSYLSNLRS